MGNRFIEALRHRCHFLLSAPPTEPNEVACAAQGEVARVAEDRIAINAVDKDPEALASWHLVLPGYEFSGGTLRAKNARASLDSAGNAVNATSQSEEQSATGGASLFISPTGSAKERSDALPVVGRRRPLVFLGVGLTAGCLVALLALQLRHSDPEREMTRVDSLAASTQPPCSPAMVEAPCSVAALVSMAPLPPATAPDATPTLATSPPIEDGAAGELVPVTNVAMSDLASAAAPTSWRPTTKSKRQSRANAKASSNAHSSAHSNAGIRIEMAASQVQVSGRAVAAVITLKRLGSKHGRIRVRWKTLPGTASPSRDYEGVSSTVQFADGQMQRTIFVPIRQSSSGAEPRTFSVVLERAPRGSSLGSVTSTTVTILGDG